MESSQESDISFISFAPDSQGSLPSIPSSQEDMDVAVEDDEGWTNGTTHVQLNNFDASNSGPNHDLPRDASPIDFFKLFWTEHLTETILHETNR